jgi:hydroxyacylglutathione hydrolase
LITQIAIRGFDDNFSYFVSDGEGKEIGIVDPGDIDTLEERIQSQGWIPLLIMLTHSHFDHVQGVVPLVEKYGIPLYMHKNAVGMLETGGAEIVLLEDGDEFAIGKARMQVLHTPGHIDNAVCFLLDGDVGADLITGDTVFVEGCGRANMAGSDVRELYESIQRIKKLPDDTKIYPGHDYGSKPVSDIAWEKAHNKYFLAGDFEEFRAMRMG